MTAVGVLQDIFTVLLSCSFPRIDSLTLLTVLTKIARSRSSTCPSFMGKNALPVPIHQVLIFCVLLSACLFTGLPAQLS